LGYSPDRRPPASNFRAKDADTLQKASAMKTKTKSPVEMLKEDHAKVRKLLEQLEKSREGPRRADLLAQIVTEVEIHTQLEEEIFYPAFHEAGTKKDDGKLFHEAIAEHGAVKLLIPDLQSTQPASDEFAGKAKVLKDMIEHHAEEEEKEMFARATSLLSEDELDALAVRMAQRKEELKQSVA
jgi:hemerythrin-like domain-containing protein